jgi:hypothetical protein
MTNKTTPTHQHIASPPHSPRHLRRLEALKANDFEAYKELLKQTHGPQNDGERYAGGWLRTLWFSGLVICWSL